MSIKKQPQRTCIVCRSESAKRELVRIVKSKDGIIEIDLTGKKSGRGAYVCRGGDCYKKLRAEKGLNRAFKLAVQEEVYDTIEKELALLEQN